VKPEHEGRRWPSDLAEVASEWTLQELTGSGWTFDPVGASLRLPAIAVPLVVGWVAGQPLAGVLAAGGAFTVGFGAPLGLRGSNSLLLLLATLAIGAAAVIGSFAAWHDLTIVAAAGAFGAICGLAMPRGPGVAWIGLQCALAGVVATTYPATLHGAGKRALVIVAGGLTQTFLLLVARKTLHRLLPPTPPTEPMMPHYAERLGAGLALAAALERALHLPSGYWVPLTTLLVLRPGARITFARALARTGGTIGGAVVASAAIVALHPSWGVLAVLVVLAAFGAYLFQKATYGLLSACVTAYVVFLLSLAGQPERQVAMARVAATALGAVVGLVVEGAGEMLARRPTGERVA
jgi:hypothetical protein